MADTQDLLLNAPELDQFYSKYFSYFNMLRQAEKDRFLKRCIQFISEKEIRGAENFPMNNAVKAIVAASAVQLTLGLEIWNLSYFKKIIIHPSDFFNEKAGLQFSGETNTGGFIKLSWKKFIEGYKVQNDNLNLALHEFSHALHLNSSTFAGGDYFIKYFFPSWQASSLEAFQDLQSGKESIFRRYGKVNISEFLSVCVEHFFESPEQIKAHYPQLYYATSILLNQEVMTGEVRIDIRKEYFQVKASSLPGFDDCVLTTDFMQSRSAIVALVLTVMFFIAASMNVSLMTLIISFMVSLIIVFLYFDYRYRTVYIEGLEFTIQKGMLIYKKRDIERFSIAHLISVKWRNNKFSLLYYNIHNTFFHQEKLKIKKDAVSQLKAQLVHNKVATDQLQG